MSVEKNTLLVKSIAQSLGFDGCGISKAEFLKDEAGKFEEWLKLGFQGNMSYLENNIDKRLDPRILVPNAKSVISLLLNYYPKKNIQKNNYKVAKYAYGEDYHFVIKRKLKTFFQQLKNQIGDINGRVFVDSAPVHERVWSQKSGLGWIGKNSLLINKKKGSFFFLAEIICDLELIYDNPIKDYCGTCTKCIDACPTDAIPQPYVIDSTKCISYLTIEFKEAIPNEFKSKMDDWIFGCDICQDVCPWNKFSLANSVPEFEPKFWVHFNNKKDWEEMTLETFNQFFKNSAIKRTKYNGLKRNIEFIK